MPLNNSCIMLEASIMANWRLYLSIIHGFAANFVLLLTARISSHSTFRYILVFVTSRISSRWLSLCGNFCVLKSVRHSQGYLISFVIRYGCEWNRIIVQIYHKNLLRWMHQNIPFFLSSSLLFNNVKSQISIAFIVYVLFSPLPGSMTQCDYIYFWYAENFTHHILPLILLHP